MPYGSPWGSVPYGVEYIYISTPTVIPIGEIINILGIDPTNFNILGIDPTNINIKAIDPKSTQQGVNP